MRRGKDALHCRHGDGGQCLHCMPLNPWDPTVLQGADPPIKHMSFHTYLRQLCDGADRGRLLNLEDLRCTIKPNCYGHAPWPAGLCTKCQPSAVTLARQPYRHTDYVEFETPRVVDAFIQAWRDTGCQRVGYLLGRYEEVRRGRHSPARGGAQPRSFGALSLPVRPRAARHQGCRRGHLRAAADQHARRSRGR